MEIKIIKEIKPRQNNGAFVLRPIELVDPDNVKKIIPGFYDAQPMGKVISIMPNLDPSDYWMLSRNTRKIFSKKYYAVVVPIAYKNRNEDDEEEKLEVKKHYRGENPEMIQKEEWIKAKQESASLIAPEIRAKFSVHAMMLNNDTKTSSNK